MNLFGAKERFLLRLKRQALKRQTKSKFEQLKSTIVNRLLPLFPSATQVLEVAWLNEATRWTLNCYLQQQKRKLLTTGCLDVQKFFESNWPSICVLSIGAILLTLVVRRSDQSPMLLKPIKCPRSTLEMQIQLATSWQFMVRLKRRVDNSSEIQCDTNAEVQLTKLIQEDPDSAAKIIETWIRDAA